MKQITFLLLIALGLTGFTILDSPHPTLPQAHQS